MKKLLLTTILLLIGISLFAQDKISYEKVRPDGVEIKWDTVRVLNFTDTVEITVRNLDINGNSVGEFKFSRSNAKDDPTTHENEATTEGRDLMDKLIDYNELERAIKEELEIE